MRLKPGVGIESNDHSSGFKDGNNNRAQQKDLTVYIFYMGENSNQIVNSY